MRSQRHKRPRHRVIVPWPDDRPDSAELVALRNAVAAQALYVGSAEHKSYPSPVGHPALRSDASRCDPRLGYDVDLFTEILREGIRRGCVGAVFEGQFPKYVWGWLEDQLFEARHINGPQGTYKAYLLEEVEYPQDPQGLLDWEAMP